MLSKLQIFNYISHKAIYDIFLLFFDLYKTDKNKT